MTELIYFTEGCYLREFDATVVEVIGNGVILDKTACYPEGGGQPCDTGVMETPAGVTRIIAVKKNSGNVIHEIDGNPPSIGDAVHVKIDWERRYAHMRMHTAQHLLSGIVYNLYNARTVGNQIHADYSRVDFMPVNFTQDDIEKISAEFNRVTGQDIPVKIYMMDREAFAQLEEGKRANLHLLPQEIKVLRIVEIPGYDVCPCAGTHLKNLREVGKIKVIKVERKGKDRNRIVYALE
jgi:misacylated tRNA(Ala) deacylase